MQASDESCGLLLGPLGLADCPGSSGWPSECARRHPAQLAHANGINLWSCVIWRMHKHTESCPATTAAPVQPASSATTPTARQRHGAPQASRFTHRRPSNGVGTKAPCMHLAANSSMTTVSRNGARAPMSASTGRGTRTGLMVLVAADEHRAQARAKSLSLRCGPSVTDL